MDKIYIPKNIEEKLYNFWEKNNFFKPKTNINKKNFCIVMPPPNITGKLHMGHAFQHTIMDILIRYNRMKGKNTLWQSGIDHAGIATQMIVEKNIFKNKKNNINKYKKKKIIEEIWKWKKKSQKKIFNQMRRLGDSVFWKTTRFTLDKKFSKAVRKVFIYLYKNDLIYKRKKISNWDIKLKTVISDLEVQNKTYLSKMWYIKYPFLSYTKKIQKKYKYIIVGTTRPETLFGDTAVAVHPEDIRYKNFIGQFVIVPLVNRVIPIISDKFIDINKGTGCVKITPAHDFQDYEIGIKHKLPMINFLYYNGTIRKFAKIYNYKGLSTKIYSSFIPKKFHNLDRLLARNKIIFEIKKLNLLKKIKKYYINISYGDRSSSIIEPMLTNQWYLRIHSLAKNAIKVVQNKSIIFISKKYENIFFSWMKNINDWCISRQLYWGHRIPVWYDKKKNIYVGKNIQDIRKKYNIRSNISLIKEKDVLDTWFSSSLWTFVSLGWPNKNTFLKIFHTTNVLVSGFDIIFFWIARMIMITIYIIKDSNNIPQIPFKKIYITGLIRDEEGNKMSKSKGNVIDPLDLIDGITCDNLINKRMKNFKNIKEYNCFYNKIIKTYSNGIEPMGADALRLTFTKLASNNRYINWNLNILKSCRNFCTKLWNASYFIFLNTINKNFLFNNIDYKKSFLDLWIYMEFNKLIKNYKKYLNKYRFDLLANLLYNFFRNIFCDWYLELSKPIIKIGNKLEKKSTQHTMLFVLEIFLRLAHPIIPFITEYIWQKIKFSMLISKKTIMLEKFPKYIKISKYNFIKKDIYNNIEILKKIIINLRKIRIYLNLKKKKLITIFLKISDVKIKYFFIKYNCFLKKIAYLKNIIILKMNNLIPIVSIVKLINNIELFVPILNLITINKEQYRLKNIIQKKILKILQIKKILSNYNFIKRASKNIIQKKKDILFQLQIKLLSIIKQEKIIIKSMIILN